MTEPQVILRPVRDADEELVRSARQSLAADDFDFAVGWKPNMTWTTYVDLLDEYRRARQLRPDDGFYAWRTSQVLYARGLAESGEQRRESLRAAAQEVEHAVAALPLDGRVQTTAAQIHWAAVHVTTLSSPVAENTSDWHWATFALLDSQKASPEQLHWKE